MAGRRKKGKNRKSFKKLLKILGRDYKCWLVIIIWAVFVLLLTGYFYLASLKEYLNVSKNSSSSPLVSMNRIIKGWVEIDYGNGKKRIFVADFHKEFPLAAVLDISFGSGKLKLVIKNGVIKSVGGVKGHWTIYRNKKSMGTKLDNLTIKGGDKYTIKKEK